MSADKIWHRLVVLPAWFCLNVNHRLISIAARTPRPDTPNRSTADKGIDEIVMKQGPFDVCCKASWAPENLCDIMWLSQRSMHQMKNVTHFLARFFREFARIRGSLGDKPTTIQNFCRHRTALKVGDNCNDFESFDFGVKLLWTWLIH